MHPQAHTPSGFWIAALPAMLLPPDTHADDLGSAVLAALKSSELMAKQPTPADIAKTVKDVVRVAGCRSWAALQSNSLLCLLSLRASGIEVMPTRNAGLYGHDKGFHELPGAAIALPGNVSRGDLGATVVEAFKACT